MNNKIKKKYKKSFFLGTIKKEIKCFQHRKIYIYIFVCKQFEKKSFKKKPQKNYSMTQTLRAIYKGFFC